MSKDKYPSVFLRKMEPIVFIIPPIFFVTRAILKIREYPQIFRPRDAFGLITLERNYLMDCRGS